MGFSIPTYKTLPKMKLTQLSVFSDKIKVSVIGLDDHELAKEDIKTFRILFSQIIGSLKQFTAKT